MILYRHWIASTAESLAGSLFLDALRNDDCRDGNVFFFVFYIHITINILIL